MISITPRPGRRFERQATIFSHHKGRPMQAPFVLGQKSARDRNPEVLSL